jgi:hypothetical protein
LAHFRHFRHAAVVAICPLLGLDRKTSALSEYFAF